MKHILGILVRFACVVAIVLCIFAIATSKPGPAQSYGSDPEEQVIKGFEVWAKPGDAVSPYQAHKKYYRHTRVVDDPRYLKKYGFGDSCSRVVIIYDVRIVPIDIDTGKMDTEAILRIRCE